MTNEETKCGEYVSIKLSSDKICLVDAADIEKIKHIKWRAVCNNKRTSANWYVRGYGYVNPDTGKRQDIFMHRLLLDPPRHLLVDHVNGNGLDNRRSNLRLANFSQNTVNRHQLKTNKTSKYIGVSYRGEGSSYQSMATNIDDGSIYLGCHEDEHMCALLCYPWQSASKAKLSMMATAGK